ALAIDGVRRPPHEDAVAPALQKLRIFERLQNNAAHRSFQPRESCRVRHAELRAGHFEKDAFQTLKSVDHARRRVHIQPPLGWRGRPRTQYVYHRLGRQTCEETRSESMRDVRNEDSGCKTAVAGTANDPLRLVESRE